MQEKLNRIYGDTIQLEPNLTVSVEDFCSLFENVDFSYEDMIQHNLTHNFGYEKLLERWKTEGVIS